MWKEKIDAYIEGKREEMLRDLSGLIRIDSTRGEALPGKPYGEGPARAVAAAGELMENYGLAVTNYDNYMIAGDFGPAERELDILAHLDVVPVSEDWTVTAPFEPKIEGDRIYGRGSIDDKGPAIAALYAVRAVKELGIPLKKGVRLLLGSDEECGSSDLEYYFQREKSAPCTFTPDADFPLINLEKARLAKSFSCDYAPANEGARLVCLQAGSKVNVVPGRAALRLAGIALEKVQETAQQAAAKTGAEFTVTAGGEEIVVEVRGVSAHASLPQGGCNALTAALELVTLLSLEDEAGRACAALAKLFPHGDTAGKALGVEMEDEISGALTMNLGILTVADGHLEGSFDCRAPLCATDENLTQVMQNNFAGAGMSMEEGDMTPGHYVPADSPFVETLLSCYESWTGKKEKPLAVGGGTYVHEIEGGVAFGCEVAGVDHHMHGDDEFMEIDVLLMSAKIFADAIVRICGE